MSREHPYQSSANAPLRWRERANQWLDFPLGRFLDYGCGRGQLLETVAGRCSEAHGVDVDVNVLREVEQRLPGVHLRAIGIDGRTTYPDGHFDTIALVEVIEHVPDERATLLELARMLKPGGRLLLTTPHRGLLTFLDVGNVKFIVPRIHRFIHRRLLQRKDYYEARFVRSREVGLIGDISVAAGRTPWHRHYCPHQIAELCPSGLRLEKHAVYFPGMRAFMFARQTLRALTFGSIRGLPWPLTVLEHRLSLVESHTGDQLVMLFRKDKG